MEADAERCEVVRLVDGIASHQRADGSVGVDWVGPAQILVHELLDHVNSFSGRCGEQLRAASGDLTRWVRAGLDQVPHFDETIENLADLRSVTGHDLVALLGVMDLGNSGRGAPRLEAFFGRCYSDAETRGSPFLRADTHEPSSVLTLAASVGFKSGETLAIFPEQYLRANKLSTQAFAVFIIDRFVELYRERTLPMLPSMHPGWDARTSLCSDLDLVRLRRNFAERHDHYHETGPRRLSENLELRSVLSCGVIEEIRVDLHIIREALASGHEESGLLAELTYLDRVIRLPRVPASTPSADAFAGRLIKTFLSERVDLESVTSVLDVREPLADLLNVIEDIEALTDDDDYRAAASSLVDHHVRR